MKILLPIDGSKTSLNAAKHVAQLVSNMRNKCTVTLISVHDDFGLNHVKQFVSKSVVDDYLRVACEVSQYASTWNVHHLLKSLTHCMAQDFGAI